VALITSRYSPPGLHEVVVGGVLLIRKSRHRRVDTWNAKSGLGVWRARPDALTVDVLHATRSTPRTRGLRMTSRDTAGTWCSRARRLPVDDAYTEWFNAHSHWTQALRGSNAASKAAAPRRQQLHVRRVAA
jgi:hypothetical protein